jgi:hypothetical protein
MPDHPETAATRAERADLETLGTQLSALGGKTILVTGEDRRPCLHVLNPLAPAISKRIYAQADFFWWPPAEPVGPRTAIAAASVIARALAIGPTQTAPQPPGRNTAA